MSQSQITISEVKNVVSHEEVWEEFKNSKDVERFLESFKTSLKDAKKVISSGLSYLRTGKQSPEDKIRLEKSIQANMNILVEKDVSSKLAELIFKYTPGKENFSSHSYSSLVACSLRDLADKIETMNVTDTRKKLEEKKKK